jgi:hypothetical protein
MTIGTTVGRARCSTLGVAFSLFAFFFVADIHVDDDGSGRLVATYPAPPINTPDKESARFVSATTSVERIDIRDDRKSGDRIAHVELKFTNITQLSKAPELAGVSFDLAEVAGGRRLRGIVRSPTPLELKGARHGDATIHLSVPGKIVTANARTTKGSTATWRAPVTRYFAAEGIPIDVTYRPDRRQTALAAPPSAKQ